MRSRIGFLFSVILLLFVLGLVGFLVSRNDRSIDLSAYQRNTLAPQTLRVLENIDQPLTVMAFYKDLPAEKALIRSLVDRYRAHCEFIEFEFIDLDRRPELARLHAVTANRTLVLRSGELEVKATAPGEAELTGAIVRLLSNRPPRVLFLSGLGGASVEDTSPGGISSLGELLRRQNFDVEEFSLVGAKRIPAEADCVVLAAPEAVMTAAEEAIVASYLRSGGRMLAMVEPLGSTSVDSLLLDFGIRAHDGFIVDPSDAQRNIVGEGNYRIALCIGGSRSHPITESFAEATLYPIARSLEILQPSLLGVAGSRLVVSAAETWLESDMTQLGGGLPEFDESLDLGGPLSLAVAASVDLRQFRYRDRGANTGLTASILEMSSDHIDVRDSTSAAAVQVGDDELDSALAEEARIVAVGDVDFVNNANLLVRGNSDLLVAMMLWLTEQENRIALAPRPDLSSPIVLTANQRNWMRILGLGVVPGVPLLLSLFVLWRRRSWV